MSETGRGAAETGVRRTSSEITAIDRRDHVLARWGVDRNGHRVAPGLYVLGDATPDSPVFVSANYTLSFDALRSALAGIDCRILVLDTRGVNVWCAAGKGTFGTDELVARVESTRLADVVNHRTLILPQLGATGVSAHEVSKRSGFRVKYGPVRAGDIPAFLANDEVTDEMRQVRFGLIDRVVLIPVDLVKAVLPMAGAAVALFLIGGTLPAAAAVAAVLAGTVLFPILLPWIPSPNFSTKGFILGGVVALPFALAWLLGVREIAPWMRTGGALAYLLAMPPVTAFIALNFTGSTTFTSKSGVEREIKTYVPVMAWVFGCALVLSIVVRVGLSRGGAS